MADRWVQQNLSVEQQVTEIYVATFGRAPDAEGLAYWVNEVETGSLTIEQVAQSFFDQPETQAKYPSGTTETSFVLAVYTNALQRSPDAAGFNYWVAELESGAISRELFIISILRGAYDDVSSSPPTLDNSLLTNLRIASEYYSDSPAAQADQFVLGEAYAVLEPVTADASTIALSQALTREFSEGGGEQRVFTLTDGIDTLVGNDADNSFFAPVVQNDLGALSNTFETGDVLNGGDGRNVLRADLITSASTTIPIGPAISATTNDIQEVYLRAQNPSSDILVNWSAVDAERMFGVEQWWTDNSRSTIQIEDVRSLPEATTFGMRQTDPVPGGLGGIFDDGDGASLLVYFDPAQVADDRIVATESDLTLVLVDSSPDANELENFPVDGVIFELNGERYTVEFDLGVGAERTYANLVTQLNAALDADPELSDLNAVLNPDNTVTISDPNGGTFEAVGYSWIDDVVPPSGTLNWDLIVGAPIEETAPVETNVVLDDVGRTSQGGSLDIGSMGDGGVAVFNVTVDRSSWLTEMASNSNLGGGPGNLETVNLVSTGANGDLAVGFLDGCDGRVVDGLWDVRTVDGSAFLGSLNLGLVLTDDSIDRYLAGATEEVEFNYTASAQDDIFTIDVDRDLSGDPDFAMNVLMGDGDDRLILLGEDLTINQVSVDGGDGDNTFVTSSSVGTEDENTFKSFSNFQSYEVEGSNDTEHDFTDISTVTSVVIATEEWWWWGGGMWNVEGVDTTLIDLADGMGVVISGKNQTCGDDESNNDQLFGTIAILGADGATMDVTLQNTARVDGVLTVDFLGVAAENAANPSAVRTLNVESAGERQSSNVINHIDAPLVNTFNFTGTQDLSANLVSAANSTAAPAARDSLVVDASVLEGDLDLQVNAAIVTNIDAAGETNTLIGTDGDADVLSFYGAITTSPNTEISEFETIAFGLGPIPLLQSNGVFDAVDVNDVELYDVSYLNGPLSIINMDANETVQINTEADAGTQPDTNDLTLVAAAQGTANTLTVNYLDEDEFPFDNDTAFASDLIIQDYRTINLDLGGYATADEAYTLRPVLLNADGNVPTTSGALPDPTSSLSVYARTLVVTGGGDRGAAGDDGGNDSLIIDAATPLSTALTTIDFSGYVGDVTAELGTTAGTADVNNVTVVVNGYDLTFTQNATSTKIVTYEFSTDAVAATEDWTIDGFRGFAGGAATLQDLSILDLSELGVNGLADIVIVDDGVNTTITSNEGLDFEIILTGVVAADLSNENFSFA